MIVLDLSILNQKGTPMFNSDTFANRPTFGIVGRIFISTDTKEFYRDTGTSWELIGGPGSGTITGSGAATQVAFWNGTSTISGSNNLYWDSTNNNLGINTNTPGNALDVHGGTISTLAAFNQTTATNNTLLAFLNSNTPLWRIGNFYTGGANDFSVFDVIGNLQQFTIVNTTGQTFVGAKTTAAGRLVVNSATADSHLQVVGANSPSIRIDNAGSGGTQRFVFGLATATNNFIQGAAAGEFCISTQSAGNMLFGMWQTINASEVMRITTANNLLVGSSVDNGNRFQVTGAGTFSSSVTAASLIPTGSTIPSNGIYLPSTNTLGFSTGGSVKMVITAPGVIGIGTTSPIGLFEVKGDGASYFTRGTKSILLNPNVVGADTESFITTSTGMAFAFGTAGTERMRITSGGNLLIGTASNGASKLRIVGLPTSAVGLSSGDVYSNAGILTIVP